MKVVNRNLWIVLAVVLLIALFAVVQVYAAPSRQEAPKTPPAAVLELVSAAGNDNVKGADPATLPITASFKIVTDTKVGSKPATVVLPLSGLSNVPIDFPVRLKASSEDAAAKVMTYTWSFVGKPADSKVTLPKDAAKSATLQFMPDVPGAYMVSVALTYADGTKSPEPAFMTIHAGTYVGVTAGNCKQCHPDKVEEWAKTGHATIFTDNIDNLRTPDVPTHYSETCVVCHTTGWYKGYTGMGGFTDVMSKTKWVMPTFAEIDKGGNFAKMPKDLQNMANIQCEVCHGPAGEHVAGNGRPQVSMDNGVCDTCHNGSSHHDKGLQLKNSAHSDATAAAWNTPTGPAEQQCVRCHSGAGYVTFLDDPTNPAAWDNSMQTVGCSTCHDPHSNANPWQLRVVSKPVALPFEITKDVGLSATCFECHNSRTDPAKAVNGSFPHYSSAAELLSDTGGVTYGKTAPNSPHGMMVGAAPIPNPAAADDPEAAKFLFSATDDTKGNIPGPCVVCHQWPGITDKADPNYEKVGGHSFSTTSPDGKFDYTAACKSCHGDQKTFDFTAKADYDGNGKVEGVQDEVKGLLNVLWGALEKAGMKKVDTGYPYATLPKGKDGKTDPKISNAWYNFRIVYGVMWGTDTGDGNQGAAQAVHNFKRSAWLLQQSYKDLTGNDVPKATLMQ